MKRDNPERAEEMGKKIATVEEIVKMYKENYAKHNLRQYKNNGYSLATFVQYFGSKKPYEITALDMEKYKTKRLEDGVKKQSIDNEIALMRAVMNKAELWNYNVKGHPFTTAIMFKVAVEQRTRILSEEEEERLMAELPAHARYIVNCSLLTAMRRGEILGLRWKDVDLLGCTITLESCRNKSARTRTIAICDDMAEEFLRLKANSNGARAEDHIFLYNGKPIKEINSSFANACKRAGIENFHFHDLRRTAATRLLKRGANIVTIKNLLGHTSLEVTLCYLGINLEDMRNDVQLLNRNNRAEMENKQKMAENAPFETQMPLPNFQGYVS